MAGGINPSPAQRWDFLIVGARCLRRGRIGAEAEAVGAAQRRARPAAAAGRRRPGARPARRRGRQAEAVGGCPVPSTSSSGSGPALARCSPGSRAWPAGRRGRGRPDRRPQVSTRKKATGPDRAAGRRRPGARPARGRGRQAAGVGVARCRARPAAAAGQRWPGARPARGRGQQSKGSGPPGAGHVQQGQRASAGQVLADVASRSQGLGFGLSGVGHILQRQRPGLQGLVPVKNCPKLHEIHESGYRPRSIR